MSSAQSKEGEETALSLSLATTRAMVLEDERFGDVRVVADELYKAANHLESYKDYPSRPGDVRVFIDGMIAQVAGTVREKGELGEEFAVHVPSEVEDVVIKALKLPGINWKNLARPDGQPSSRAEVQAPTRLGDQIVLRGVRSIVVGADSRIKNPRIVFNPNRK